MSSVCPTFIWDIQFFIGFIHGFLFSPADFY